MKRKLKPIKVPLSDYPSIAIRQCVEDIEAVEATEGMKINMGTWHNRRPDGTCEVCAAGAIAVRRYPYRHQFDPMSNIRFIRGVQKSSYYKDKKSIALETKQVESFDFLRRGKFYWFLSAWVENKRDVYDLAEALGTKFRRSWVAYDVNPTIFKKNFLKIADFLESEGY